MLCNLLLFGNGFSNFPRKKVYGEEEPILLDLVISNNGKNSELMPLLFTCKDYYVNYTLRNAAGNQPKFIGIQFDVEEHSEQELRMRENSKFTQKIDLRDCFLLNSGKYTLFGSYCIEDDDRPGSNHWAGCLESNKVDFIVR